MTNTHTKPHLSLPVDERSPELYAAAARNPWVVRTRRLAEWAAHGRELDALRLPASKEIPGLAELLGTSDELADTPLSLITMPKTFLAYELSVRIGLLVVADGTLRAAAEPADRRKDDLLLWDTLITELRSWLPHQLGAVTEPAMRTEFDGCMYRALLDFLVEGQRIGLRGWMYAVVRQVRGALEAIEGEDEFLELEDWELEGEVLLVLAWLADFELLKLPAPLTAEDIVGDQELVLRLLDEDWMEPTDLGIWYAKRRCVRGTLDRGRVVELIGFFVSQLGVERTAQVVGPGPDSSWAEFFESFIVSDHPRASHLLAAFESVADRTVAQEASRAAQMRHARRGRTAKKSRKRSGRVVR